MGISDERATENTGSGVRVAVKKRGKPRGEQGHTNYYLVAGGVLLWLLAVASMVALSFLVHAHRQPFPFELSLSREIQASITEPWIGAIFRFLTWISNPLPDVVTVIAVLIVFAVLRWFRQGIFLALSVIVGNGIDALIGDVVQRPRPMSNLIHVDSRLIFNSFPSGHSCHMMVFYGFILFLTLTPPVRTWRHHWLVLLLQLWAVLNICIVGYARLWEGEHWALDVLGGYLDGAIWMSCFIFLYLLVTNNIQKHKRQKNDRSATNREKRGSPRFFWRNGVNFREERGWLEESERAFLCEWPSF